MPIYQLIFIAVTFFSTGILIYLYLRSTRDLLKQVQQDKDLWQRLGKPTIVQIDGPLDISWAIKPILPWLSWILSGQTPGINLKLMNRLLGTRRLLMVGLLSFSLTIFAFLLLFITAPSGIE